MRSHLCFLLNNTCLTLNLAPALIIILTPNLSCLDDLGPQVKKFLRTGETWCVALTCEPVLSPGPRH